MDSFLQRLFHDQVWTQCKFATFAYDDLVERIPTLNAEKGPSEEVQALAGLPLNQLIAESGESASEHHAPNLVSDSVFFGRHRQYLQDPLGK